MTFMQRASLSISAVLAIGFASPSLAQVAPGQVSVSLDGGASFAVGGIMHGGANAPIANLGVLNPSLAGIPATLNIERRSQNDVYDTAMTFGGEIGYGVSESGEVLFAVSYVKASGNRINVGGAAAGAPVNATLPVFGDFKDYKSLALQLGYRQYLGSGSGLRPFVTAKAGATRISAISADFTVPAANIALNNVPFSKASWAFSGGADMGVSIRLSDRARLEPEVGILYTGGANGNDAGLGGLGLGSINNDGKRWSVPVRLRLKFTM